MAEKEFALLLIPPDGKERRVPCDSVRFSVPDGMKTAGGSVGIRRGHTDALMSVAAGELLALRDGAEVFRTKVGSGIAAVKGDCVTVLAPYETEEGESSPGSG